MKRLCKCFPHVMKMTNFKYNWVSSIVVKNESKSTTLYIIYLLFVIQNCHMYNIRSIKESWWSWPSFKYLLVYNATRRHYRETIVNFGQNTFVDICGIDDHHCLIFLFLSFLKIPFIRVQKFRSQYRKMSEYELKMTMHILVSCF